MVKHKMWTSVYFLYILIITIMKITKLWQPLLIWMAVFALGTILGSCEDNIVEEKQSKMSCEWSLVNVFGSVSQTSPFVSENDFLFVQWNLTSNYSDNQETTGDYVKMAFFMAKAEDDETVELNNVSDLTSIYQVDEKSYSEADFMAMERILLIGDKKLSLKWGNDVISPQNINAQSIEIPYLKMQDLKLTSCTAENANQTDENGQILYQVTVKFMQEINCVNLQQHLSRTQEYVLKWLTALN